MDTVTVNSEREWPAHFTRVARATLRDLETGTEATRETRYPETHEDSTILWHWTEGNYGCDCNRSLFLYDLPLHEGWECNSWGNCIELVRLEVDGECIFPC